MPLTESSIRAIVDRSVRLLERKCIRLNSEPRDWRALLSKHMDGLLTAPTEAEFEKNFNAVLAEGGLSHIAFFHESAQHAPARYAINATFCASSTEDGRRWVFEDVHVGGPAHAAGVRRGDILLAANGQAVVPPETLTFGLGRDHEITIRRGTDTLILTLALPKAPKQGKAHAKPPMAEPTAVTARRLEATIGYLSIAFFPGVNGQRFAQELDAALLQLAPCSALIVDLRGNLGGFVGSLRLMSYLTPNRLPIGYSLTKRGEDRGWRPDELVCIDRLPSTTMDIIKMAVRFKLIHRDRSIRLVTEGLGAKTFHGRIVLLVNEHTLSAGEMVAAFAKENKLATIVGTRTGGQVLGGANFSVGSGYILRLPAAGWHTWHGSIVEGIGVEPDVDIPLSLPALRAGIDNQLQIAIERLQGVANVS
jgi:carboxyl-terminal processing protease